MAKMAYTVTATLPNNQVVSEYIEWLNAGHIQAVIDGGADSAAVVRVEDPATPHLVETRYVFRTREALARYLDKSAPALRAEGLVRFPPASGISFRRQVGTIEGEAVS